MNNLFDKATLVHHSSAINVLNKFYDDCDFVIFVEGDDDHPFWDNIFKRKKKYSYKIIPVNGKENLKPYIKKIKKGKINQCIVACDSDYTNYSETNPYDHPLIVKTFGYSIENSMYCPYSVASYINKLTRSSLTSFLDVEQWYDAFCLLAKEILPYDILNYIDHSSTESCYGDNCCRFLIANNSPFLDSSKINTFLESIKTTFSEEKINLIVKKISKDHRELRYIIKGHFLTHGITNFIKYKCYKLTGEKVNLSNDAIFAQFVCCNKECGKKCKDKRYLYKSINTAIKFIIKK